ncbi:hypothetical protein GCM10029964_066500 [Kibdelosporangium lantanae]
MEIRPVRTTDAETVNELLHQLGYPQDDVAATAARIQAWSEDSASAAYAAEADGKLLGVIAVHISPFFERTGTWARIVALVVSDQARNQGIGGELVAAAESFAASRGAYAWRSPARTAGRMPTGSTGAVATPARPEDRPGSSGISSHLPVPPGGGP